MNRAIETILDICENEPKGPVSNTARIARAELAALQADNARLREVLLSAVAQLGTEDRNDQLCLELAGHIDAALSTKPEGESVTPAPAGAFVTLETCEWSQMGPWDFSDVWETACGQSFCFSEDGGPGQDGVAFCCYCGKKIVPVKAKELGEDEDDTAAIRDAEKNNKIGE